MENIKEQLMEIAVSQLQLDPQAIEHADQLHELGDSLSFLDLIAEVESRFNIRISNAELEALNSFRDLVDTVEQGLSVRA